VTSQGREFQQGTHKLSKIKVLEGYQGLQRIKKILSSPRHFEGKDYIIIYKEVSKP